MDIRVSVIIPVKNDTEGLEKCLACLARQTYPRDLFEIIVVDNASEKDVKSVTDRFKGIALLYEKKPGPAAARNRGILAARGEVMALTDSDCVPADDWLQKGMDEVTTAGEDCVVAGHVEVFAGDPARQAIFLYDRLTYLRQDINVRKYGFAATANVFVPRDIFERAGMFDDDRFCLPAGEDLEWGRRVVVKGCAFRYAPDVVVGHPASASYGRILNRVKKMEKGMKPAEQSWGPRKILGFFDTYVLVLKYVLSEKNLSLKLRAQVLFIGTMVVLAKIFVKLGLVRTVS